MPGDLHTHTNFSDGSTDIETLPFLAARAGLRYLAVSDHDTLQSIDYAQAHPVQQGVTLIPAVELTARDTLRGRRVHLLCYCPDRTRELAEFCALMARRRNEASALAMADLERLYPQFSPDAARALAARSGVLYKTHLIRVLYEYGYTDGIYKDLYRALFGRGGKARHGTPYEPLETVLAMARRTRGVLVLAHPTVYESMDLARELAEAGAIDGVEIDHPRNSEEDKAALRQLAARCGLLATGGTDFHGMHMSRPVPLGAKTTDDETVGRILALAEERKSCEKQADML